MKFTLELAKPKVEKAILEQTYQLTLRHNEPKQDITIVKRNLSLDESIIAIKEGMSGCRSIELTSEQTGEVVYQRYASLDFYPLTEVLDNDTL